jgi:tight adherence protein B
MNAPITTPITIAAIALLVVSVVLLAYEWIFRYRVALRDRVKTLMTDGDQAICLFKDLKQFRHDDLLSNRSWSQKLQLLLDQAGFASSPLILVTWTISFAGFAALLAWWAAGWLGAAMGMLAGGLPAAAVLIRGRSRRRQLSKQLPEAFQMISRAVRAGQTVQSALKIIAEDFRPPISEEFSLCYQQQNLGVSRESSLRKLAQRTGIMELQIFVVALLVQARSGGNLVELLDNLAMMVRKRLLLKSRIRALTGEGRTQARILLVLPAAALAALVFLSPDYARFLLDRPRLLLGTALCQAGGIFWARRIVNFEY